MTNTTLLIALILFIDQLSIAQISEEIESFVTPFGEFNFQRPEFPETRMSIIDFGAQEGGEFKNTTAINNAIKKLSESGGGTVVVPPGKWLTGPIVFTNQY